MKLINKTILITGGTSGIGLELAKRLQDKNKVIILGSNQNKLIELKGKGFEIVQCDLSDFNAIEQCVVTVEQQYSDLDILFNNAGVQYNYSFIDDTISKSKIANEITVNTAGQILLTQLLIPVLSNSKSGLIVNTTSALGLIPKADALVYSSSKAAMRNFTFGLRKTLKETTIKVIEFIPPVTETNMTKGRNEKMISTSELVEKIIPQIEKDKKLVTTGQIRFFNCLSRLFPNTIYRLINKRSR